MRKYNDPDPLHGHGKAIPKVGKPDPRKTHEPTPRRVPWKIFKNIPDGLCCFFGCARTTRLGIKSFAK